MLEDTAEIEMTAAWTHQVRPINRASFQTTEEALHFLFQAATISQIQMRTQQMEPEL